MNLKFTEELCVVTIKNDTNIEDELTCRFKIGMRNSRTLTRALVAPYDQIIKCSSYKSTLQCYDNEE